MSYENAGLERSNGTLTWTMATIPDHKQSRRATSPTKQEKVAIEALHPPETKAAPAKLDRRMTMGTSSPIATKVATAILVPKKNPDGVRKPFNIKEDDKFILSTIADAVDTSDSPIDPSYRYDQKSMQEVYDVLGFCIDTLRSGKSEESREDLNICKEMIITFARSSGIPPTDPIIKDFSSAIEKRSDQHKELDLFLENRGVTQETVQQEANLFNKSAYATKIKIKKRALLLEANGLDTRRHSPSFQKNSQENQVEASVIRECYRLFKRNVQSTNQMEDRTMKATEMKGNLIYSSGKEIYLQQKPVAAGAFKMTFLLKNIYSDGESMVSQRPHTKEEYGDFLKAKKEQEEKDKPLPSVANSGSRSRSGALFNEKPPQTVLSNSGSEDEGNYDTRIGGSRSSTMVTGTTNFSEESPQTVLSNAGSDDEGNSDTRIGGSRVDSTQENSQEPDFMKIVNEKPPLEDLTTNIYMEALNDKQLDIQIDFLTSKLTTPLKDKIENIPIETLKNHLSSTIVKDQQILQKLIAPLSKDISSTELKQLISSSDIKNRKMINGLISPLVRNGIVNVQGVKNLLSSTIPEREKILHDLTGEMNGLNDMNIHAVKDLFTQRLMDNESLLTNLLEPLNGHEYLNSVTLKALIPSSSAEDRQSLQNIIQLMEIKEESRRCEKEYKEPASTKDEYEREIDLHFAVSKLSKNIEAIHKIVHVAEGGVSKTTILKPAAGHKVSTLDEKGCFAIDLEALNDHSSELSGDGWKFLGEALLGGMKGLQTLHEKGYIHRDIKPPNFLISKEGIGQVTDFGSMVRAKGDPAKKNYIGTPSYSAPESTITESHGTTNYAAIGKLDAKMDVWSIGMTLYALYEGEVESHPVFGDPALQNADELRQLSMVHKHKGHRQAYATRCETFLMDQDPSSHRELRQLIIDCTRADPQKRPEMKEVIKRYEKMLPSLEQHMRNQLLR